MRPSLAAKESVDIRIDVVGLFGNGQPVLWPPGWPVPRVGDDVHLPNQPALSVRTVEWLPQGDQDTEPAERVPFVYVVIGPPRPS